MSRSTKALNLIFIFFAFLWLNAALPVLFCDRDISAQDYRGHYFIPPSLLKKSVRIDLNGDNIKDTASGLIEGNQFRLGIKLSGRHGSYFKLTIADSTTTGFLFIDLDNDADQDAVAIGLYGNIVSQWLNNGQGHFDKDDKHELTGSPYLPGYKGDTQSGNAATTASSFTQFLAQSSLISLPAKLELRGIFFQPRQGIKSHHCEYALSSRAPPANLLL